MNIQVERECIKALAYGKEPVEVASVMNVSIEEVNNIASDKIATERKYLQSMGYM